MGLPVTIYRWDDAGAPQINNAKSVSSVIDIFRKCLVSGYGEKLPLGWSVAFENTGTFKIAFRNNTTDGSGSYVQIWNTQGTDTAASNLIYQTAQSMSALDALIRPGYQTSIFNSGVGPTNNQWILIGTSTGFYFAIMNSSITNYTKCVYSFFIGDLDSFVSNDQGRFIGSTANADNGPGYNGRNLFASTISCNPKLYQTDGSSASTNALNNIALSSITYSAAYTSNDAHETAGIVLNFAPLSLSIIGSVRDSLNIPVNHSLLQPQQRGVLPGLLISSFVGYKTITFPITRNFFGQDYMLMPGDSSGANRWINIVEW